MAALGLAAFATAGVAAPPKPEARAEVLQKLLDCRKLSDDPARLACYDARAGAMDQAEAKGDIVVVDREQARTVRRQAFGFSLPSLDLFQRGEAPGEVDKVLLKVESARRDGGGKWVLRLDGQVWRQIDTAELTRDPKVGATVRIRRASMGSFLLSPEGSNSAIRVHRDE